MCIAPLTLNQMIVTIDVLVVGVMEHRIAQ
jgi:hypothetical protein